MSELETIPGSRRSAIDAAILCVDDEPGVLAALGRALGREPYGLVCAPGGLEALDLLECFPVKVVVADQRMPGMTGTTLLAEVRRRRPEVHRIILTAFPVHAVRAEGFEAGADYLLTKPWDDEELRRTIRRLLRVEVRPRRFAREIAWDTWRDLGGEGG